MAGTEISSLVSGSPVESTDRIPIARVPFADGDNFYVTPTMLKTFFDAYYDLVGAAADAQAASQPLDADLTALAALDATAGLIVKTGSNTYVRRSIAGTTPISVADGAGTAANPTISLDDTAVAPASYTSVDITVDAKGRLTAAASGGLGAETWTGRKTFAENADMALDAILSADGKWTGIVQAGTAGAALAFGELCYLQTSDSRWEKAKADAAATSANKLGICVLAAAADGDATVMLLFGNVRADSLYPTFTIGAAVYVSAATAGLITSTAPTGTTDFVVRKIGFANSGDEIHFCPSNDYITLA